MTASQHIHLDLFLRQQSENLPPNVLLYVAAACRA